MKPKDLEEKSDAAPSDPNNEHPPISSGTRTRFTLSSPFYQGGTTFGGSAGIIRVSDHFNLARLLASEVNKSRERETCSGSTESKILKRRRLYAFLNQKEMMYRKYRKVLNNPRMDNIQELEETQMSFRKNSGRMPLRTFFFSEPIPLKPLGSKRSYAFPDPTPLN
ncbi:uncharacterized protein LOC6547449 [Drosophila erecta]|uniref:Uncharacterized protein n=1 Tax=Drosophila erecta TaxID=7220 RepID=B3NJH5_DROER|nr:uncharacterized protein LOC6547449 [Drosophila erecta]EDV55262.1 uncharacterized protein Dere_GG22007 [Drosophila erecta]